MTTPYRMWPPRGPTALGGSDLMRYGNHHDTLAACVSAVTTVDQRDGRATTAARMPSPVGLLKAILKRASHLCSHANSIPGNYLLPQIGVRDSPTIVLERLPRSDHLQPGIQRCKHPRLGPAVACAERYQSRSFGYRPVHDRPHSCIRILGCTEHW